MSARLDIEQDLWLQELYLSEIEELCNDAAISARYIDQWPAARQPASVLFYHLRMLVHLAALVSQFLWPIQERNRTAQTRGAVLRNLLDVPDGSPLMSRKFRHHLAHFDERLDEWAAESPNRNIARKNIAPRNAIGGNSITSGDFLEHFVPGENVFIFRGDEFPVQEMFDALMKIHAAARTGQQKLRESRIAEYKKSPQK